MFLTLHVLSFFTLHARTSEVDFIKTAEKKLKEISQGMKVVKAAFHHKLEKNVQS